MGQLAAEHGYWGFMPTMYSGLEQPVWEGNPKWLAKVNGKFREAWGGRRRTLIRQRRESPMRVRGERDTGECACGCHFFDYERGEWVEATWEKRDYYLNPDPGQAGGEAERCSHRFASVGGHNKVQVGGALCGLPATWHTPSGEPRCYFHAEIDREDAPHLRGRLEEAVEAGLYLGEASLRNARLHKAQLDGAVLVAADLRGADLSSSRLRDAKLRHVRLEHANLKGASLQNAALWQAQMDGVRGDSVNLEAASLDQAKLRGAVLRMAHLEGACLPEADLTAANLNHAHLQAVTAVSAIFRGANLRGAKMQGANLDGALMAHADLRGADLDDVLEGELSPDNSLFASERHTSARHTVFFGVLLSGASISTNVNLQGARFLCPEPRAWWHVWTRPLPSHRVADELVAKGGQFPGGHIWAPEPYEQALPTLRGCADVYRQLKLNSQHSGDYQTAGEYYLREMECERAAMVRDEKARHWWNRFVMAVMYFSCGYGERPWRVLGWVAVVVSVFAFVHGWLGITDTQEHVTISGIHTPSLAGVGDWLTALYFSIVTFTTLGFGDLRAAHGAGRGFAAVEALLGFVLLSLFLVCIVRKFSR